MCYYKTFDLRSKTIISLIPFQNIDFTSIQVESPRCLVVNGRVLGADNEALATLSVSAMSE